MNITKMNLNVPVNELMSTEIRFVGPDTLMSEIDRIFKTCSFHHLPVINEEGQPVGMISKSDYHKLQHHFTIFNSSEADENNIRLFESLIAEEVMSPNPIVVDADANIDEALKLFMSNIFHSLIVVKNEKCVGIITPYDFIEYLYELVKS